MVKTGAIVFLDTLRHLLAGGCSILLVLCCLSIEAKSQTAEATNPAVGYYRPDYASVHLGYGTRSNDMHGLTLGAAFRAPLSSAIDLEARIFERRFIDTGFGFAFVTFLPDCIKIGSNGANIEPMLGISCTVWSPTVAIGIPMGFEMHYPIISFLDASIGGTVEPQFNLNVEKNTTLFDLRIGIRYHQ